jgi:hypothetical protein
MDSEFENQRIEDFGEKLDHAEGLLGAYLPSRVFDSAYQKQMLECTKFSFSRLRNGRRPAMYWELGRFVDLFDLGRHGLDYRVFLRPFAQYCQALQDAGVGSHGASSNERLREVLRREITPEARISIRIEGSLAVGGIGSTPDSLGIKRLSTRDSVTLTVPLAPEAEAGTFLFVLHDFPAGREMQVLMPSRFAPVRTVHRREIRLPQPESGEPNFPVNGVPGYRCLYGIQSNIDLTDLLALAESDTTVPDIGLAEIVMLMDVLTRSSQSEVLKFRISFGEYVLA